MWANAKSSQICTYKENPCAGSGTYNANSSSTYKYVSSNFNVSYADGSGASGDYVTDTLSIGGKSITGLQYGVGYDSSSPQGILGIGYGDDESQVNRYNQKAYANLPQAMANEGLIQSNAYSLWLNDLDASTGSILFGGVDTNKYHGALQSLPAQKVGGVYAEFIITLSGISLSDNGKNTSLNTDLPTPVILDSGSSLMYLPNDLATAIYQAVGAQYSQSVGAALANCNLANQKISLDFTFTSPTISVPMSELIIQASINTPGNSGSSANNEQLCVFGISPAEGSTAVLGDTFLRSAYVVYDLANNEISLAQTDFNATGSHVSEIGTGSAAVPGATAVASPIQAAASQTGGARIGVSGTVTVGGSTATSTSAASSMQVPHGVLALLVGVVAVVSCAYFVMI